MLYRCRAAGTVAAIDAHSEPVPMRGYGKADVSDGLSDRVATVAACGTLDIFEPARRDVQLWLRSLSLAMSA